MQDVNKVDKPKYSGSKPVIPSKPKYVPPVNLKCQKIQSQNITSGAQRPPNPSSTTDIGRTFLKSSSEECQYTTYKESYSVQGNVPTSNPAKMIISRCDEYSSCYKEKTNKFSSFESNKVVEDQQKAPNSPSTVCCSILPNAAGDCCGTININKKDIKCGDIMTKVDSLDSNSSDSGGFKDFIQPTISSVCPISDLRRNEYSTTTERKASHSEKLNERRNHSHQRQTSQPDLTYHENRHACVQNKPTVVPSAQALAHFLPSSEQQIMTSLSSTETGTTIFNRRFSQSSLPQSRNLDDSKSQKARPQISSQSSFQQSSKKLEELFAQRLERDKLAKKGMLCTSENENKKDIEEKMQVQRQIQQKLHADLQQTVKHIQEIQSTELRLPQNRKWPE
ncbi:hypothetical protein WA026_013103, partial [Henosepilachna vigintioctopunctata]